MGAAVGWEDQKTVSDCSVGGPSNNHVVGSSSYVRSK
jgi:hypothetical protein